MVTSCQRILGHGRCSLFTSRCLSRSPRPQSSSVTQRVPLHTPSREFGKIPNQFHSEGAPEQRTLDMQYTSPSQFRGYHEFRGTIGAGRIYIHLENGVIVKGKIVGGPQAGQAFVGAGTWTRS
ncbi:hypothetical protein B0J17DRAFT_680256 [Rhizoctonia solani]|nr:hypothetical protein B0J17DRAFT_680256 [Rhizoctonia solani]